MPTSHLQTSAHQADRSMSREVVYWLMNLKAEGVAFLAYDDVHTIALLRIDDALYEFDYADVEHCIGSSGEKLSQHLKRIGRLVSGLAVTSVETDSTSAAYPLSENQTDRRCG